MWPGTISSVFRRISIYSTINYMIQQLMHAHLPPYFYWFYQPASGIWEMRVDWKGGGKVISTTTPLFPSKQRIYISDRTDNTGHCLTKIWLTQPLPACFVRQSGSRADRARRGWVSPIFIRRWPALSLLSLIYILSF